MMEFELGWAEALGREIAAKETGAEAAETPPKPRAPRRSDSVERMMESRRRGGNKSNKRELSLPPIEDEE